MSSTSGSEEVEEADNPFQSSTMVSRTSVKHAEESKEPPATPTKPERKDNKFKRLKGKNKETITIKSAINKSIIINSSTISKRIQMVRETKDNLKKQISNIMNEMLYFRT